MTRRAIIPPSGPPRPLDSRPAARYSRHDGRGRRLLLVVASTDVEVDHGNSTRLDRRATGDVVPVARLAVALQHWVPGVCRDAQREAAHNTRPARGRRTGPAPEPFGSHARRLFPAHEVPVPDA